MPIFAKPSVFRSALALVATFSLSLLPAHGQASRIAQPISSGSPRAAVANTVSPRALAGTDLGEAPADRVLPSVTLRFTMTDAQSSALDALLGAQQNPASPLYRQWLTPEQFGARFGMSTADLAKTSSWLQSQGLTVTGVARGRSFITVSGTVAKLNTAFATSIHSVQVGGEQHIANLTDPTLPSPLAKVVGAITGLNDIRLKPHAHPHFTSSVSGSHFIAPGDFYTIYDINPLLTANVTGSGVTIAVAGQTDIVLSDIAAFRSASGLTANPPTVKLIGTDPGTPLTNGVAEDQVEASLDVEWSGAVAPAASILYVNSTDVISGSLTQIIDQNLAPIATISYGNCESGFGSSNIVTYNQLFRQAAAQGQTIAGPAGDSGATDCDYQSGVAAGGLAVDFPASSPYVTGVGGTMFNETPGVTYWNSTNGTDSGSALSYIPEAVWNETGVDSTGSNPSLAAGGGGASAYFIKPAWQVGSGVPADSSRDVPDLSFSAASNHDGYLYCQGGFCTNGYRDAANTLDVVGGTSVATPAFAGIMALLEQKLQTKVGLANPTIYALADSTYYTSVFHDVTTGTNDSPCTLGTVNCTTIVTPCDTLANTGNGCIGYSATAGYDLASGWGSLDVFNFVNDWSLVTPLSSGTNGTNVSATTVTPSSTSVTTGTTITFTVNVASATPGVTSAPTGNVQLTLDGTNTGSIVALTSGTATITYDTTNLASGTHIFGVTYSGDATYDGSKGTVSVNVTSLTAPDFTLSPTSATATAKSGGTANAITFTVAPTNGFTGNVTFAATTSAVINASYSFTPAIVDITTTASGTTVFTLVAAQSNAVSTTGLHKLGGSIVRNLAPAMPWQIPASGVALAGLLFFALPKRRSRWGALVLALASLGVVGVTGCGGSSSDAVTTTATTAAAAGTYTINVTASGTNAAGTAISHSATVTFVVN